MTNGFGIEEDRTAESSGTVGDLRLAFRSSQTVSFPFLQSLHSFFPILLLIAKPMLSCFDPEDAALPKC